MYRLIEMVFKDFGLGESKIATLNYVEILVWL